MNDYKDISKLKWTPWIGNDYFIIPNDKRILLIGETHYHNGTALSIAEHEKRSCTIEVIKDMAIDRCYYQTKLFQNIHKVFFKNDSFNSGIFWHQVAFYNFIQRPMNTNLERPTYEDFYKSWEHCFELLEMLKPNNCIFLGASAANSFEHAMMLQNNKFEKIRFEDFISNSYARTASYFTKDNQKIEFIFIRHPSKYFSWNKWNEFLRKKIGNEIDWLEERLK